jgi:hypothetical protein
MATTKIWDGTTWRDLEGPQGPAGPTVVSADAVNVAKLGTDGKILVAQADLDLRYVNVVGDTMTGPLAVTPSAALAAPSGHVQISGQGFQPAVSIQGRGDTNGTGTPQVRFLRTRGTAAAPASVQANDNLGTLAYYGWLPNGTAANPVSILAQCDATPAAGDTTAKGRITLLTNTFVCTATNFTVNGDGFATIKDGVLVQRTRLGTAGQFETSNVGSGETGYGIQARCTGTSLTSGSVTGLRGEAAGTYSVGVGVRGQATGTADTNYGIQAFASNGTIRNVGLYIGAELARVGTNFAIESQSSANSYLKGELGLNWATPTHQLEVGGTTMIRSTLEVVGNITSAGTAHSFAAGSIPSSAVVGGTAFTPATSAAAGAVGSMRWDENFLYVRTATAWKRVALAAF